MTEMQLGVWYDADTVETKYGAEAKCYETAVFDGNTLVGKPVVGFAYSRHYTDTSIHQFGLKHKVRRVKNYRERVPSKDEGGMERVTQRWYDVNGNLIDLKTERRMVYTNSKGNYIKTRSAGRVFLNEDNEVNYQDRWVVYAGGRRYLRVKQVDKPVVATV